MRKTLFLHEVKPPTSKTFKFFQCKGITPFLLHLLSPDFFLQIVTLFIVRYAFALPPLFLRFKTVPNSMQVRSLEWAKNGTYKGFARELLGNYERGIEISFYGKSQKQSDEKKICHINRRLFGRKYVTLQPTRVVNPQKNIKRPKL